MPTTQNPYKKLTAVLLSALLLLTALTSPVILSSAVSPPPPQTAVKISGWNSISPLVPGRAPAPVSGTTSPQVNSTTLSDSTLVWFGGYLWVVIGWNGEGVASTSGTATLLLANTSPNKPSDTVFHSSSNVYSGSTLQSAMNTFYSNLSAKEKAAIVPRTLDGGSGNLSHYIDGSVSTDSFNSAAGTANASTYITGHNITSDDTFDWYAYDALRKDGIIGTGTLNSYTGSYHPDKAAGTGDVSDQYVWPLSVAEASLLHGSVRAYSNHWWLRSPGSTASTAAYVSSGSTVYADGSLVDTYSSALRPALLINLESVIFTSAASGASSKSNAAVGNGLIPAELPSDSELKLTVLDSTLNLSNVTITKISGNTITFSYSGAVVGNTLSAVVLGENGEVKYYGKLLNVVAQTGGSVTPSTQSGAASVTLPDNFNPATDRLCIFVENANGDKQTDYAGTLLLLSANIELHTVTFNPNSGTVTPTSAKTQADGTLSSLPTPTRAGYMFKGWFTAATDGTPVTTYYVFTDNTTVYAQWQQIPTAVTTVTVSSPNRTVTAEIEVPVTIRTVITSTVPTTLTSVVTTMVPVTVTTTTTISAVPTTVTSTSLVPTTYTSVQPTTSLIPTTYTTVIPTTVTNTNTTESPGSSGINTLTWLMMGLAAVFGVAVVSLIIMRVRK